MSQLVKGANISEKKYQNIHNLQDKIGCKIYCNYKVNASNISILIIIKFIKASNETF